MLNTAKNILGALIIRPSLIESIGDIPPSGLFSTREKLVFGEISRIWEDDRPDEILLPILNDRLAGKILDSAAYVASLIDGLQKTACTAAGIRQCVREIRGRKIAEELRREAIKQAEDYLKTGNHDPEGVNRLVCRVLDWETHFRGNDDDLTPNLIHLETVKAEPVEWLWPGRFPHGKVVLLSGDPGTGKSFFSFDLAARITTNRPAPDGKRLLPGSCLFLVGEDGLADTIRVRADMLNADPSKIIVLDGVTRKNNNEYFRFDDHFSALERAARLIPDLRLIVVDPIASFLGKLDANKQTDARAVMDPLAKLAERQRVTILILAHLNKTATATAVYRTSGSQQWPAAARAVFYLAPDPEDYERRILDTLKMNLGPKPHKISFVITAQGPGDYKILEGDYRSADEILQQPGGGFDGGAIQKAVVWLREQLRDGPRPANDIKSAREGEGISERTLQRAKERLEIDSFQGGDGFPKRWYWTLPAKKGDCHHDNLATWQPGNLAR